MRHLRDEGFKKVQVAERLGIHRDSVAKYWQGPALPAEPPRYRQRARKIDRYAEYITARLARWPELTAERLYQEIRQQGYTGSRRTVRRFVAAIRPHPVREYKPIETLPGEQAQVDWGHFGTLVVEGARVRLYAFILTLAWSRVIDVEFITSLSMATLAGCLHRAFQYIGGVPRTLLFDNAKTVVAERVGGVVRYQRELLQLAALYGFAPRACWGHDPESKGKVESMVKYVRRGFFYGREFTDLADLNRQVRAWMDEVANARVHATTGAVPWDRLAQEAPHLKPLEVSAPQGILEQRKATRTNLISIEGNRYSVPARFARRPVSYRRFEDHIEILEDGQVVDRIDLVPGRGRVMIRDDHDPQHQTRRQPAHPLQARFEALAPSARTYLEGLSRSWSGHLREQMERIVTLAESCPSDVLEQAMQRAIHFEAYGYGILKRLVERLQKTPASLPQPAKPAAQGHVVLPYRVEVERRDLTYYQEVAR
ncbi:IS21 family transposase [Carboxydochorda subterranea]|uniref:IS21 family transposase n=1 Tax=Carboxydichorda subterranea TaxID=3109565 RepID=A0ABZ1C1J2_9FIRM|nr:IS21 family transposase [Limnochorda sp. L945t]WRP18814.1 IS21 family transposase [Limnochorda sp. L945t]